MNFKKFTHETKKKNVKVVIRFNPFTNKKNKMLKGFVDVFTDTRDDEGNGYVSAWNGLSLLEGKKGLFLSEPIKNSYEVDGETKYTKHYIMPQPIKDNAITQITEKLED